MRPPKDIALPRGWRRCEYYIGTTTDTWRIYTYRHHRIDGTQGELWAMTRVPYVAHRGSIESCIEFARAAR